MHQTISARSIMLDFAKSTGLTDSSREPQRYLWTDAFAVCNYLTLYRQSGEQPFLQLALKLVEQVHRILGRHRRDSVHSGWLSSLDDEQAQLHPTRGGLRIGKPLDERQPGEPVDEALEWNQDGQYFHYLTKWMLALNRVSQVTGTAVYNQWARELAEVAHAAFCYTPPAGGTRRMYWKMSIDLSRPLVASMGQHDPLDGLVTCLQLQATAKQFPEVTAPGLGAEIEDLRAICAGRNWATEDPLGIGGLLTDAFKLVQLIDSHQLQESARLETLLRDIESGLQAYVAHNQPNLPAEYRLAFRELGLAIGLHAIGRMQQHIAQHPSRFSNAKKLTALLTSLARFQHIGESVESFWLEPGHRGVASWLEHTNINNITLATSLEPEGYLEL